MKKKIPTRRIKFKVSASNGDVCKISAPKQPFKFYSAPEIREQIIPLESLPGCETCPSCGHETLPKIKLNSLANGRRCSKCGAIVDRLGNVENDTKTKISSQS